MLFCVVLRCVLSCACCAGNVEMGEVGSWPVNKSALANERVVISTSPQSLSRILWVGRELFLSVKKRQSIHSLLVSCDVGSVQ